ncbi:MAG: DUF881 domain-containing protein [Clostridiales bacterium]|nr:DUF881 domain-containing protein [Clostridiales bacterium]
MKNKEFVFTITFICFVLGLIFTMQIKTVKKNTETTTLSRTTELQAQYAELKKEYDNLSETLAEKEKQIQDYRNAQTEDETKELLKQDLTNALKNAGLTDVRGQGVVITMNDSLENFGIGVDLNSYLVHDEDLLNVVNELKATGAEAISINDQRIIAMSEIRCAGTTILVNGKRLSPPYVIKAIGDSASLESGVTMRGGYVDILKGWGIRIDITKESDVFVPKYSNPISSKYMTTVEETVQSTVEKNTISN